MGKLRVYMRGRSDDGYRSDQLIDITSLCSGIQLEGAVEAASRKLTFNALRAKQDYYLGQIADIRRGDGIILDDGSENYVFYGVIWRVEETDDAEMKSITCYDNMKYLMTSEVITNIWTNVTPGEVTETVCKELGVTCESLPECDLKVSVNARGKNGYEAIMIAWTEAHKQNGKVYYPRMVGYKLHVIEKGEKLEGHTLKHYSQDLPGSIIQVSVSEDTSTAITSLWSRNGAGTATWIENDEELNKLYGYIVGVNDAGQTTDQTEVKAINDGEKLATVEAIGDWQMQTGWSVAIESTLLSEELLYIESDVHYYENGIHTMELELSYENSMDEIENDPIETADGTVSGNTTEEKIWNFLRAQGFTAAAAAGVMGNMYAESGMIVGIEEYGGGGGYGLCQWTGSRRTDLVNWCANNGYSYSSLEGQLNFLMYEVETYGYTYIMTMESVEQATRAWLTDFERAGIARWDVRISAANDYYNRWHMYEQIPAASGVIVAEGDGLYTGSVGWPFAGGAGTVTQQFVYGGHRGWDISTRGGGGAGSPVLAVEGGVVVGAGWQLDDWSYGNAVTIQHTSGLCTRYAHLSSINVSAGMRVSKGQQIGVEGNTGNSYGTHLHIEFLSALPWGTLYDPANYLNRYG